MLRLLFVCILVYLICSIELLLRRIDFDDAPGYIAYMLGVGLGREAYFDDDERLDGERARI